MMSARPPIGTSRPRVTSVVGISDRVSMPRIGKLRLGEKKTSGSGKEYPSETDYFRIDPDPHMAPDARQILIDRFHAEYGERAQILTDVYFPSDVKDFAFSSSLEWWGKTQAGGKLLCQGNGVEAQRLNVETGQWESRPCCQVARCPEWEAGKSKLMTRLRIFLPKISMSGYFQIDTSSQVGTGNVLDLINHLLTMFGRLTSIPLTLSREPKPIPYEGKTTTHYVLVMRAPNVNLDEFKQIVSRNQFLLAAGGGEVDLEVPEEDVPEELVPAEVQEPAVDPELLTKIKAGFDILGTNEANRAASLHQFKGREEALLVQINRKVDRQQADCQKTAEATV
jgi:hypothetical protein